MNDFRSDLRFIEISYEKDDDDNKDGEAYCETPGFMSTPSCLHDFSNEEAVARELSRQEWSFTRESSTLRNAVPSAQPPVRRWFAVTSFVHVYLFPYFCGVYGGGSFLLQHCVCLLVVASPLFALESMWGQAFKQSVVETFREIHPRWSGVSFVATFSLFLTLACACLVAGYALIYLTGAFASTLPWRTQQSVLSPASISAAAVPPPPSSSSSSSSKPPGISEVAHFLTRVAAQPAGPMPFSIPLAVAVAVVCGLLAAVQKPPALWAKVSFALSPFPLAVAAVLLVRALSLEGAGDGLAFFMRFEPAT
eukprot:gene18970-29216_t